MHSSESQDAEKPHPHDRRPRTKRMRQRPRSVESAFSWRRLIIRTIALLTCLAALAGLGVSYYLYQRVDRAQRQAEQQVTQLSAGFEQISATLRTVSVSSGHAATTVEDARSSLGSAADASRSAAATLDQTASLINFTILGQQPLAGVDKTFRDQASQLRVLADTIDLTRGSLGQNAGDLRAISADVSLVAQDVNDVGTQVRELNGSASGPGALAQIAMGTKLLLLWSLGIHLLLFAVGVALFLLSSPAPD